MTPTSTTEHIVPIELAVAAGVGFIVGSGKFVGDRLMVG